MNLAVTKLSLGEKSFLAITCDTAFSKWMVYAEDGSPFVAETAIYNEKTRKSTKQEAHLNAAQFLRFSGELDEENPVRFEYVKIMQAYIVKDTPANRIVLATAVKYLRENTLLDETEKPAKTADKHVEQAAIAAANDLLGLLGMI
jgi:hypothetical protein